MDFFIFLYVSTNINFLNFAFKFLFCPIFYLFISIYIVTLGQLKTSDKNSKISSWKSSIITLDCKISLYLSEYLEKHKDHKNCTNFLSFPYKRQCFLIFHINQTWFCAESINTFIMLSCFISMENHFRFQVAKRSLKVVINWTYSICEHHCDKKNYAKFNKLKIHWISRT